MKRLALFLDGTWNRPGDNTNVWRMYMMTRPRSGEGVEQLTYYDTGVGTAAFETLRGGALGKGLSRNVREAYQWIMRHFEEGDEVFIFGFSRGAYTARSLAGLIARCGLLAPDAPIGVRQIFDRYKRQSEHLALPLHEMEFLHRYKGWQPKTLEDEWLLAHSTRIDIRFLGVWDTVGSLGVPFGNLPGLSRKTLRFHNTRLSKLYQSAYHALAVDEHRAPYDATLWTRFTAHGQEPEAYDHVEQRWFCGAHSNVGGGYQDDPLAQIPLRWLQQKAHDAGLDFRCEVELTGREELHAMRDSFSEFLRGTYKVLRFGNRYYRTIGGLERTHDKGTSSTVNETVDESVLARWRADPAYRPRNLREWAERTGRHPETLEPESEPEPDPPGRARERSPVLGA